MSDSTEIKSIADRYEVRKTLGRGAHGTVYLAHDRSLLIDVAVKVLDRVGKDSSIIRFQQEAITTGKLNHPCIARTLDFNTTDGKFYMVMEYISGVSLQSVLAEHKLLPIERALPLFLDICKGLVHAHAHGILHRDLKPANILIVKLDDGREAARIVDFGIAKMLGDEQALTDPNAIVGSPAYMSPEQGKSEATDARSDVYSLGCVMFETICGQPPIVSDTALDTIRKKVEHAAPSLGTQVVVAESEALSALIKIVDTCLKTSPEMRFQNVSAVQQQLESIDFEVPEVEEKPAAAPERKALSRDARIAVSVLLVSLIAAGGIAFGVLRQANDSAPIVGRHSIGDIPLTQLRVKPEDDDAKPRIGKGQMPRSMGDSLLMEVHRQVPKAELDGPVGNAVYFGGKQHDQLTVSTFARDEDLKSVRSMLPLKRIIFERAGGLTEAGLEHIAPLPIEGLIFTVTNLDDKALKVISQMQSLHTLRMYSADRITDEGLKYVSTMKNLDDFRLESTAVTSKGVEYLSALPHVSFFEVGNSAAITDDCVASINKHQYLDLGVPHTGITTKGLIEIVRNQKKLETLHIEGLPLDMDAIEAISQMPTLVRLFAERCTFSNRYLERLAHNKKLVLLNVSGHSIDEKGLAAYANKPMDALIIRSLNVTKPILQALGKLDTRNLELSSPRMYDSQLPFLVGIKNLGRIKVSDVGEGLVSREGLEKFKELYERKWKNRLEIEYDPLDKF